MIGKNLLISCLAHNLNKVKYCYRNLNFSNNFNKYKVESNLALPYVEVCLIGLQLRVSLCGELYFPYSTELQFQQKK